MLCSNRRLRKKLIEPRPTLDPALGTPLCLYRLEVSSGFLEEEEAQTNDLLGPAFPKDRTGVR